ncbi:hypothetical protein [Methanoregula sp.]|uniref:hypothetical protein n=1 Tax=Methanoregula sp. TaxID=2052170 RepID=UPI002B6ECCCA|nr:hypothetical protein [Methanoregula sp.]HVP96568.1 hypothetical protein [Methanoregula sp.]
MDIIADSVNRLEEILSCSGCEETGVRLDVDPDAKICQYERGACLTASFGGRTAEFVTDDPIRAMTRISFMFGASLDTPAVRSAACAIINVATAFFCLSRVRRSCPVASHAACLKELTGELTGRRVFCAGALPALQRSRRIQITDNIHEADTILVNNEGIIAPDFGDMFAAYSSGKRIIWLGPSTSGVCRLQQGEHWCPYGQPMLEVVPDPSRQNG